MKTSSAWKLKLFAILKNLIFSLLVTYLAGCASIKGAVTEEINNRKTEYALVKHDGRAVVFENGLGGSLDWWAKVFPEVSQEATVFAYNRPGYKKSERASTPRDGVHVVEELRAILKTKQIAPPYVLVGHSLGGLYMQLYARLYPAEVKALVLVDSTHPEQLKGDGAVENWPWWVKGTFDLLMSDVEQEELGQLNATGEMVLSLPEDGDMPVFILSALQPLQEKSRLADDSNAKRRGLALLYPHATQIWVDSGHGIPLEKPEEVIKAIQAALNAEASIERAAP